MSDDKIREAIRKLAGTHLKDDVSFSPCTVNTVNQAARTCDCTEIGGDSGNDLINVQLMADVEDGFFMLPVVGSTVIVSYSTRNSPYVSLFSAIQAVFFVAAGVIQFNDGSFGGLTKTQELVRQLTIQNSLLTAILSVLNGAPIPEPGSGAPSALQAALKIALIGQQIGDYSDIENTTIVHGI